MNTVCKAVVISIFVVTFMQGIYIYVPATNHNSKVYSFAAVLHLQFVIQVMIFSP